MACTFTMPFHHAAEEKVHAVPQRQHARVLLLQVRHRFPEEYMHLVKRSRHRVRAMHEEHPVLSACVDGKHKCRAQGGRSADGTPGVPKDEAQRIPEDLVAQLVRKALVYEGTLLRTAILPS